MKRTNDIYVPGAFRIDIRLLDFQLTFAELKKKSACICPERSTRRVKLYRTSNMQLRTNGTALIGNKSVSKYRN